jgi:hypothetical protein
MMDQSTLTMNDIAQLAQVSRPVVSMWRRRPTVHGRAVPFPIAVETADGIERFDRDAIVAWLDDTGRGNNRQAGLDAPAAAAPDDADLDDLVSLLALSVASGAELGGQSAAQLTALAERIDGGDRMLLREIRGISQAPRLAGYIDELLDSSYGPPDALNRLLSGRAGRAQAERGFGDGLIQILRAVTEAARQHLGDDVALHPPANPRLARHLADGFAGVFCDGDGDADRAQRRIAAIDGVPILDDGTAPAVTVASLIGVPESAALQTLDELTVTLDRDAVRIVVGPASLLCETLNGDAEQNRSQTLRTGNLALAIRLPRGLWKAAHRQSLALWVLRDGRRKEDFRAADLDAEPGTLRLTAPPSRTVDPDDLASDVTAALADSQRHAFRYSRRTALAPVLAGAAVVPRGIRAARVGVDTSDQLDRIHAASLITSQPVRGWDVDAGLAAGQAVQRHRSVAELTDAGELLTKRGTRIDATLHDPHGTVGVQSADGSTDGLRFDPLDATARHPRAVRTEPGDVIVADRPRPAARVDREGGALVAAPSRILRLLPRATIGPYTLAAVINELAAPGSDWQTWSVPDLRAADAEVLDATLAEAADHLAELRRRERATHELTQHLIQAVAAGAVTIAPEQKAG